ncbi:Glycosyltransferase Family 4 [Frankineae bacterium MT45]|nr:Glycosyltransferase Family 4 [Frankineae bacterium MT45]
MMDPNKRGPVELQLAEMARLWTADGGEFVCYFIATPPAWYRTTLEEAGAEIGLLEGVTDQASWNRAVAGAGERPALAHFHFGWHDTAAELVRGGAVVIRTEHSERKRQPGEPLRRLVRHHRQRPLHSFIAVSDYLAAQTRRDYLVSADRVRRIHNGADLDHFRPRPEAERRELRQRLLGISDDRVVITQAAFLDARKRQDLLIRAMPELLAAGRPAHLVLAGGGDREEALRGLITELGVADRVSLLSGDNDVAALYAASDIGALLTDREGLGGSAIEAMACGLPLVTSDRGGLREVPEVGVSGVLVDHDVPGQVVGALAPLIDDEGLRRRMGAAALLRARTYFDQRRAAQQTVERYREILGEVARPARD